MRKTLPVRLMSAMSIFAVNQESFPLFLAIWDMRNEPFISSLKSCHNPAVLVYAI